MATKAPKTHQDITRYITRSVERELWGRAAGRCEFDGCNRPLYLSPVTQQRVNLAERAHIHSFSKEGPRGWGPLVFNKAALNSLGNLLLLCHDCHKLVDDDKDGTVYSAALLSDWKRAHEDRIAIVAGVSPSKQSHVVMYGASIGAQASLIHPDAAKDALFPHWYPSKEEPTRISMSWEGRDSSPQYWDVEAENLKRGYERFVRPLVEGEHAGHLSLFGIAPMPLLVLLGSLVTDKSAAQVYQLHREPYQTWRWQESKEDVPFEIKDPLATGGVPVLIVSLSDTVPHGRAVDVLGADVAIWELTVQKPHNDFLRTTKQLSMFREAAREVLSRIARTHGRTAPLHIMPAMPVACAIELGRVRMPKADGEWRLYDYHNSLGRFAPALRIGSHHD